MNKPRNSGRFGPLPGRPKHDDWCARCTPLDPGVVDHYSRDWTGGSPVDPEAQWVISVMQRTVNGAPERAELVIHDTTTGNFTTAAALIADLSEAQSLVDALNVGMPHREMVA